MPELLIALAIVSGRHIAGISNEQLKADTIQKFNQIVGDAAVNSDPVAKVVTFDPDKVN